MPDREPIEAVKDRAHWLVAPIDEALEAGEIDETEWHRRIGDIITPAYLAADTPWEQSGRGGDECQWAYARSLICDAIQRDGSFLDVGCANGFLMESVQRWAAVRGRRVEPHGLDISPELADLARSRLPAWAGRIHTGNVVTWQPPRRFDFVRTGLEYVPPRRRCELVQRLLDEFLVEVRPPHHRHLPRRERKVSDSQEQELLDWGLTVAGHTSRPHRDYRLVYRAVWIDA